MQLRRKIIGELFLIIPIGILFIFGIGEIKGGISSGYQHFTQLIPLLLLAIGCWFFPRFGGSIVIMLSVILAMGYFLISHHLPFSARLLTLILLFAIPFTAGWLFVLADRKIRLSFKRK